MITRDYWRLSHPDAPMAASYGRLAQVEDWRTRDPIGRPAETYAIAQHPFCYCCGEFVAFNAWNGEPFDALWRCPKHLDRNPCAIEGCRCTTDRRGHEARSDQYLCAKHWRPLTTKRERAQYSLLWRRGKKLDWPYHCRRRLERFWDQLVARARRRAEGDIDMREINKLFGWND